MQINLKVAAIYTVVVVALAVGATKRLWPTIDTKLTIQEKEVVKKDIQTVIKEVVRPDGTKETVTTIVDKSKESSSKTLEQIITKKNDWFVAAGIEAGSLSEIANPIYRLEVNRRVLGDIYVGVSATTNKSVGLQVGFSF